MKKFVLTVLSILIFTFNSLSGFSASESLDRIEAIIAGKQDKLVFGTVSKIGSSVSSVSVMEEIGGDMPEDDENEDTEIPSIVGQEIEISNLSSYMYFDNVSQTPKIGDNILVSLTFDGNVYHVKNGVFLVNEASYSTFKFLVPESVDETDSLMELTALYKFVSSNGKNADYTVKNSAVYSHDINNNEIKTTEPEGIVFIDESGAKTKETSEASNDSSNSGIGAYQESPYTWIKAAALILVGMIAGAFVVRLIAKLEKRSEMK